MKQTKQPETASNLEVAIASSARQRAIRTVREDDRSSIEGISQLQRDVAKVRSGRALGWDRERVLRETGWSLSRYLKAEQQMYDDEIRYYQQTRPEIMFGDFKARMDLLINQLNDVMGQLSVSTHNPQVFVSAVKVQGELLNRVMEMGQEMGLVKRAAKKIEFDAKIDMTQSVRQIHLQIQTQLKKVNEMLVDPFEIPGTHDVLFQRLDPARRLAEVNPPTGPNPALPTE